MTSCLDPARIHRICIAKPMYEVLEGYGFSPGEIHMHVSFYRSWASLHEEILDAVPSSLPYRFQNMMNHSISLFPLKPVRVCQPKGRLHLQEDVLSPLCHVCVQLLSSDRINPFYVQQPRLWFKLESTVGLTSQLSHWCIPYTAPSSDRCLAILTVKVCGATFLIDFPLLLDI